MNLNGKLIIGILFCSILTGCSSNKSGNVSSGQSTSSPQLSHQFVKDNSKLTDEEIQSSDMNNIIFALNNYIMTSVIHWLFKWYKYNKVLYFIK